MKTRSIIYPRIYANIPLQTGDNISLPDTAVRHIQVLRMQPGQHITLFNGHSECNENNSVANTAPPLATTQTAGQWQATITDIGRNHVHAHIDHYEPINREPEITVTLLIGIPANERMDFLIEKATELGVYAIHPLIFERSVIKLTPERSAKKQNHWQAIAIAACEQCGGNRIPIIHPVTRLQQLLHPSNTTTLQNLPADRRMLSLNQAHPWTTQLTKHTTTSEKTIAILSGPEGGLSPQEEQQLINQAQFQPYSLGTRTLRADTAPIAALSTLVI